MNLNKYTQKSLEAVQSARDLAVRNGHQQLEQVHLLLALQTGELSAVVTGAWSPSTYTRMVRIVKSFKTMVTKQLGYSVWQTSFYDTVLRDPAAFPAVRQYILANPARWALRYGGIPAKNSAQNTGI